MLDHLYPVRVRPILMEYSYGYWPRTDVSPMSKLSDTSVSAQLLDTHLPFVICNFTYVEQTVYTTQNMFQCKQRKREYYSCAISRGTTTEDRRIGISTSIYRRVRYRRWQWQGHYMKTSSSSQDQQTSVGEWEHRQDHYDGGHDRQLPETDKYQKDGNCNDDFTSSSNKVNDQGYNYVGQ